MSRLPIRIRVTAAFALALAAVLAGAGFSLYDRLSSHLRLTLEGELRLRSQDLAAVIGQSRSSSVLDTRGRFVEAGESYAQLLTRAGHVVESTRLLGSAPLLTAAQLQTIGRRASFFDKSAVRGLNEPSRVLATVVELRGRRVVLLVGATRQNNIETLSNFRRELLFAGPIALLIASGAGYILAWLSLRQVELMRRRAATISAETPGERLPVPPTGDELQRLGETLNSMLDRLESALQRERDFVADAGHELRTPLALLRTELELALRQAHTPAELREAVRLSSHEAERLSQLAEDLLLSARAERGRIPLRREPLAAQLLLDGVASRFEWRARDVGKSIHVADCSGVELVGDRLRLEQALANLVDNALRHGGTHIELDAQAVDGMVDLHVRDDGGGFPAEFVDRAFERFSRADAARSGGGAGLGLAIVRTIAESHGGAARILETSAGRTDIVVSVPR